MPTRLFIATRGKGVLITLRIVIPSLQLWWLKGLVRMVGVVRVGVERVDALA